MKVLLTGATGLVGSGVLKALLAHGHEVTALVRSEQSASTVRAAGATPLLGDITDVEWLTERLREVDGAIHAATTNDGDAVAFDRGVATAAAQAFDGSGKSYVHTGGAWVWGSGADVREDAPFDAPELTSWRADVEKIAISLEGARGTVVAPGIVYGGGRGIAGLQTYGPTTDDGRLRLIGDGSQHWTTVHADDLGELYVRALTDGEAGTYYIGASGSNPTVREIAEAAAAARGLAGVAEESVEQTRERFGAAFADALLLDQQTKAERSKALGWAPSRPTLVEEIRTGVYTS
ncbi:nucleoside-diphosphate-sugar epimerase [Motilibacter rhizosphaerae]|uniref:Nucleoside-diphosphate-sugar epimerase n=1 Tax=Motilibacter rhizosphaerae TaxID=598652 RepID=A0A4Q7NVI0_9ACTN|nr:NAD-dependent epimerase/dehydratase family protein [Motilibacter rhizosphaerae]RZS90878.1 nucleoside-diphosphate-sugar epimerase [Motilibacter rhizosphaerae]